MLNVNVNSKIYKSKEEVFDAIINPNELSKFFISRFKGEMKVGETIVWYFDDFGAELEVTINSIKENETLVFCWEATGHKKDVTIHLSALDEQTTSIDIKEYPFSTDQDDVKKVIQQTQGWTDFVCCLKAYLYTGINLRSGQMNG